MPPNSPSLNHTETYESLNSLGPINIPQLDGFPEIRHHFQEMLDGALAACWKPVVSYRLVTNLCFVQV